MSNFFNNKIFISLFSFIAGAFFFWGLNHYQLEKKSPTQIEAIEQRVHDPSDDLRQMQKQMLSQFSQFDDLDSSSLGGIKQKKDAKFTYFEIELEDQIPKELKVNVQDGQVQITGKIESKNEDGNSNSYYSSTFERSFPVPSDVEADKLKMEQVDKKIILKFPKKNFT